MSLKTVWDTLTRRFAQTSQQRAENDWAFYASDAREEDKWKKFAEQFPVVAKAFDDIQRLCPSLVRVKITHGAGAFSNIVRFALVASSHGDIETNPQQEAALKHWELNSIWLAGRLHADLIACPKLGLRFNAAGYSLGILNAGDKAAHQARIACELFTQAVRDGILKISRPTILQKDGSRIAVKNESVSPSEIYNPANYAPKILDAAPTKPTDLNGRCVHLLKKHIPNI